MDAVMEKRIKCESPMLIKLIRCNVKLGMRESFSKAQTAWSAISNCSGFHGQFGGWNVLKDEAVVLGIWNNQLSLEHFMRHTHDRITERNRQSTTYCRCDVSTLNVEWLISDQETDVDKHFNHVQFIQLIEFQVTQENTQLFRDEQKRVWHHLMSRTPGMVAVLLAQYSDAPQCYQIVCLWESEPSFHKTTPKTDLKDGSNANSGLLIHIEPAWNVYPAG